MKSLADGLPSEIARQVHPEWRKNEAAYWAVRDSLLAQYRNQWIAFADGVVVAAGNRPVLVLSAARRVAEHPYVTCVGREEEPFRLLSGELHRRAAEVDSGKVKPIPWDEVQRRVRAQLTNRSVPRSPSARG